MELHKIKKIVFTTLSIITNILIIGTISYFLMKIPFGTVLSAFVGRVLLGILVFFISIIILGLISLIFKKDVEPFFMSFFLIDLLSSDKSKWICHSNLGYFLISISDKEIDIYKQHYLYTTHIGRIDNTGNSKIIPEIKQLLDKYYSSKLKKIEEKQEKLKKLNTLDTWDGHFDTVTRRDEKIKSILK